MSSSVYIPSSSGGGGGITPPTSITVRSTSYTIPAGRFAKITFVPQNGFSYFPTLLTSTATNTRLSYSYGEGDYSFLVNGINYFVCPHRLTLTTVVTTSGDRGHTVNYNGAFDASYWVLTDYTVGGPDGASVSFVWSGKTTSSFSAGTTDPNGVYVGTPTQMTQIVVTQARPLAASYTSVQNIYIKPTFNMDNEELWVPSGTAIVCLPGYKYLVSEYTI